MNKLFFIFFMLASQCRGTIDTKDDKTFISTPPPVMTWKRLPVDHPYHLPLDYSWPDNLPQGHPGKNYK